MPALQLSEMPQDDVAEQMRADWNSRAQEDAYYYVAFGRREQEQQEFFASAADVVRSLESELIRLAPGERRQRRALEIGCGPGRLMLPMSWNFGEVHGVDVSDEMIRRAHRNLRDAQNTFPRLIQGTSLDMYGDEMFDFVYSYAVFQHIPSREVVFRYLRDARRVMKPGGILRCQFNGLPATAREYNTWAGVRISAGEIAEFAASHDMQLLALEGFSTQYMWTTMRKQPDGWFQSLEQQPSTSQASIRNVCSAETGEPAVPASGRYASIAIWTEQMPSDCDLNQINVLIDGEPAAPTYIGPPRYDGIQQINAILPKNLRTGFLEVSLEWLGRPLAGPFWLRLIPPGPAVPRVLAVTDGINLMSEKIVTGHVKVSIEELAQPDRLQVQVDGLPVDGLDLFCTDPRTERYEVNFVLTNGTGPGLHHVDLTVGNRHFPPLPIQVGS